MKSTLTLFCCLLGLAATAQTFKPFKLNLSAGYARPSGTGSGGGLALSLEPKYGISDQIDLGFRLEAAIMGRVLGYNGQTTQTQAALAGSYLLTGTYLLGTNQLRPFVGLGAGVFSTVGASFSTDTNSGATQVGDASVKGGQKLGGLIRAGVKSGHFVATAAFNLVPATRISTSSLGLVRGNNNYLSLKIGFDIGGGRYD